MDTTLGTPPTLEDLARAKFGDLTRAELQLLQRAPEGAVAECSSRPQDPQSPENDPAQADSWDGQQHEIRAELIRWLCVDAQARGRVDPRGLWVRAARIVNLLDLTFACVRFPLRFLNCSFSAPLNLTHADLRGLYLSGSRVHAIAAGGVKVTGDVFLRAGFTADGEVQLIGADIGRDLDCQSARFTNAGQRALVVDRAKVGGSVFLNGGFSAEGESRLVGTDIGRNVDCSTGSFKNPGKTALFADLARVAGGVLLTDGFNAEGEVRLIGANLGGSLDCSGGSFKNPGTDALSLDQAKVAGGAFLRNGFSADGVVRLLGANIGSHLECGSGRFANPEGVAMHGEGMKVGGLVTLGNGFTADGEVLLIDADIGGTLDCGNGSFKNPGRDALSADRVKVGGGVLLRNGFSADGVVRLLGANIGSNLECGGGHFRNPENVAPNGAKTGGTAILAEEAKLEGNAFLNNGFSAEGAVNLLGATVGGNLECIKGTFKNPGKIALHANGITVARDVELGGGFSADGEVLLIGADIGGTLNCGSGSFKNPGDDALSADRVKIAGSAFLRNGFSADGVVRLLGANIGGNLECMNGTFKNPGQVALHADGMTVARDVSLGGGFSADGEVLLIDAGIGGTLDCANGSFRNPGNDALSGDRIRVTGSVFLRNGFSANGAVRLLGANIGGDLDATKANLNGALLVTQGANVKGVFFLRQVAKSAGGASDARARIDLRNTTVGALTDDLESWPEPGNLALNGFAYGRIAESPTDATARLNWVRRSMRVGRYQPQPYEQLAKVLRDQGYDSESVSVLIGMEDDRCRFAGLPWYALLWAAILKTTIGYGYWPLLALGWIVGFVLLGFVIFGTGYRAGLIAPSDKEVYSSFVASGRAPGGYERFCAAVYSFNMFVPLIDLGQRDRWVPTPTTRQPAEYSHIWARELCGAAMVDVLPRSLTPSYRFLLAYAWAHTLLGWFFTTMFVAGITGLVRHSTD